MSDLESIINGEQPTQEATEAPVEDVTASEAPTPAQEQESAPEAPPEATPEPEAPKAEEHTVPVAVVTDLRRQLRDLQSQMQAAQPKPEPQPAPDFYEDPDKALQHHIDPVKQEVFRVKMDMSRFNAEQAYGKEAVEEMVEFFNTHPQLSQQFLDHPSPYHAALDFVKSQKAVQQMGPDPAQWMEQERAKIRAEIQAEMAVEQVKAKAAQPAPSMADMTGTGGGPKSNWAGPTPLGSILGD